MARITVVHDYPDLVDLMKSVLEAAHEVDGFDAADVSVAALERMRPDLLIIDLEAADAIWAGTASVPVDRAVAALRSVPMVVCSSDVGALESWIAPFRDRDRVFPLVKPFSLDALTAVVERALGSRGGTSGLGDPAVAGTGAS